MTLLYTYFPEKSRGKRNLCMISQKKHKTLCNMQKTQNNWKKFPKTIDNLQNICYYIISKRTKGKLIRNS